MNEFNYIGFRRIDGVPVVHGRTLEDASRKMTEEIAAAIDFRICGVYGPFYWAERVNARFAVSRPEVVARGEPGELATTMLSNIADHEPPF